eukprot:snap_masked-scaffold_30-processed-gene-2.49-mRNA-1 protein AED:1.00 eAED:1.00 QI:0/0/0/0/1/1/2/0/185
MEQEVWNKVFLAPEQRLETNSIDMEQDILMIKYLGTKYFPIIANASRNTKFNIQVVRKNLSALKPKGISIFKLIDVFLRSYSEYHMFGGKIPDNEVSELHFQKFPLQLNKLVNDLRFNDAPTKNKGIDFALLSSTIKLYTTSIISGDNKISIKGPNKQPRNTKWRNICKKRNHHTKDHNNWTKKR